MPAHSVDITAPSRLHFGMFSFGCTAAPQFGGAGLMLNGPGLHLRAKRAKAFAVQGPLAKRAAAFAGHWAKTRSLPGLPDCEIEILSAPPEHVGLGTGTQLGLSVGAALHALFEEREQTLAELVASVGRGRRSSIGAFGFAGGGLIGESGKQRDELLGALLEQVSLPEAWRFLLLRPARQTGCCGEAERQAFAKLPPVPEAITHQLQTIFSQAMAPAAKEGDFQTFSTAVYEFGRLAGSCFATAQYGEYATEEIAELVQEVRSAGVPGVGQSSWGPTVFAMFPHEQAAQEFVCKFSADARRQPYELLVVGGCAQGASIRTEAAEQRRPMV